jgi:hypothetical protein
LRQLITSKATKEVLLIQQQARLAAFSNFRLESRTKGHGITKEANGYAVTKHSRTVHFSGSDNAAR